MKNDMPFCYKFRFKPESKSPTGEVLKNIFEINLTKKFRDYILTTFDFSVLKPIFSDEMIHNIRLFLEKEHPQMPYFYKADEDSIFGIVYKFVVPEPTIMEIEFRSHYLYHEEKFLRHFFKCLEIVHDVYTEAKIEPLGSSLVQDIRLIFAINGSPKLTVACTHHFSVNLNCVMKGYKAEFRDPDIQVAEAINSILEPLEKGKKSVLTNETSVQIRDRFMKIEIFSAYTKPCHMFIVEDNTSGDCEWKITAKETELSVQVIALLAALGRLFTYA